MSVHSYWKTLPNLTPANRITFIQKPEVVAELAKSGQYTVTQALKLFPDPLFRAKLVINLMTAGCTTFGSATFGKSWSAYDWNQLIRVFSDGKERDAVVLNELVPFLNTRDMSSWSEYDVCQMFVMGLDTKLICKIVDLLLQVYPAVNVGPMILKHIPESLQLEYVGKLNRLPDVSQAAKAPDASTKRTKSTVAPLKSLAGSLVDKKGGAGPPTVVSDSKQQSGASSKTNVAIGWSPSTDYDYDAAVKASLQVPIRPPLTKPLTTTSPKITVMPTLFGPQYTDALQCKIEYRASAVAMSMTLDVPILQCTTTPILTVTDVSMLSRYICDQLHIPSTDKLPLLQYFDDEGDLITLTTIDEFKTCVVDSQAKTGLPILYVMGNGAICPKPSVKPALDAKAITDNAAAVPPTTGAVGKCNSTSRVNDG